MLVHSWIVHRAEWPMSLPRRGRTARWLARTWMPTKRGRSRAWSDDDRGARPLGVLLMWRRLHHSPAPVRPLPRLLVGLETRPIYSLRCQIRLGYQFSGQSPGQLVRSAGRLGGFSATRPTGEHRTSRLSTFVLNSARPSPMHVLLSPDCRRYCRRLRDLTRIHSQPLESWRRPLEPVDAGFEG